MPVAEAKLTKRVGMNRATIRQRHLPYMTTQHAAGDNTQRHLVKPPYTYVGMMVCAISAAPQQQQTLVGICAYIQEKFAFFRGDFCGWKDTVRYNLSRKECFVRVPEETSSGLHRQGNSWRVDTSALSQDVFRRQHSSGLHHQGADQFHADLRMHLGVSHLVSMLETNYCEQQGTDATDPKAADHDRPDVPASCKVQEKKLSRLAIQLREMVARNIVRNRQFSASQASCIPPRPASVCSTATSESSGRNSPLPSALEVESSPFEYSAFQAAVYPVQMAPSGGDPTVPPGGCAGDTFPLDLSYSAIATPQHHQHLYHLHQQQRQQSHVDTPLTNERRYPAETHLAHTTPKSHSFSMDSILSTQYPRRVPQVPTGPLECAAVPVSPLGYDSYHYSYSPPDVASHYSSMPDSYGAHGYTDWLMNLSGLGQGHMPVHADFYQAQ